MTTKPITDKGIILYYDYSHLINLLSDEEAGILTKTLLKNQEILHNPTDNEKINNVYNYIANRILDYQRKRKIGQETGIKGGNPILTVKGTVKGIDKGTVILKEKEKEKEKENKEEDKDKLTCLKKFIEWDWEKDEKFTDWLVKEKEKLDTNPKLKFNASFVQAKKEGMIDSINSKGTKYKDFKSAFRNWIRNAIKWELLK